MVKKYIGFSALFFLCSTQVNNMELTTLHELTKQFEELDALIQLPPQEPLRIFEKEYSQKAAKYSRDFITNKQAGAGNRNMGCTLEELFQRMIQAELIAPFVSATSIYSSIREEKYCQNQPDVVRAGCRETVLSVPKTLNAPARSVTAYEFYKYLISAMEELKNNKELSTLPMVIYNYNYLMEELTKTLEMTRKLENITLYSSLHL